MRKIIQVCVTGGINSSGYSHHNYVTTVLCNDGVVLVGYDGVKDGWYKLPDVPQDGYIDSTNEISSQDKLHAERYREIRKITMAESNISSEDFDKEIDNILRMSD